MKHLPVLFMLCFGLYSSARAQSTYLAAPANDADMAGASMDYKVVNDEVKTDNYMYFAPGKADILPAAVPRLNTIKKFLNDKSYVSLMRIEGHVSCGAGAQALSEARAKAVNAWLVAHGVDCKRLLPVGFGCTKPITDDHNEMNERVTFVIASLRGRAIGGMPVDGGGKAAARQCQP